MINEINKILESVVNCVSESNGHVVATKELPATLLSVLKKVGYRRKDISVVPQERVSLSSMGGDGYRHFAAIVNIDTGKNDVTYGSWGGANMFTNNPVDRDDREYVIPENGAVILGYEGGAGPVGATIYVNPKTVAGFLPVKTYLNDRYVGILGLWDYTSSYRKEEMLRMKVTTDEIDYLVKGGFLKRSSSGALSISIIGKNASRSM